MKLEFKKWLIETPDIYGTIPPVQIPHLLNPGAYPTYEVEVEKYQKKKMKKTAKKKKK